MNENYGQRLMPSCLHHEASRNPQRLFAIVASSNNVEDEFRYVTFEQVARAVNFVSNWVLGHFAGGKEPSNHPTIAYIGVPDLRYNILFYAAIQCRYKVFLPSPRNPVSVNVSLLQQTICTSLVYTAEVAPVANGLQSALESLQCVQLPSLEELLSASETEYTYDLKFADVYQEPILILHSSGSTGLPKPVIHTHGTLATYDVRDFPTIAGRTNHDGLSTLRFSKQEGRVYDVFPPFHIAGFMTKIMTPVYNFTVPIFGPPNRPPSGALAAQIMSRYEPCGAVLPPSIVEQLFHEAGNINILKKLDVLLFAGGPLPSVIGNELSRHTTLCQFYGSTEAGQVHQLVPLPEDWAYIKFHPCESCELRDAGDGLFELVLFSSKALERTSSLYHNYPHISEWRTKDLFEPHPSKPNLWKFHARNDDILVFSSGEKVNPIPMEVSLTAVPNVCGALMVGQGYPQSALLIELSDNAIDSDFEPKLWSAVNTSNALLPGHARVAHNMIIIAKADKPFQRAGKGTVIRSLTEKSYATEIEQLYSAASTKTSGSIIASGTSVTCIEDVKTILRSILERVSIPRGVGDEDDLYSYGMDSVKTAEALNCVKTGLINLQPDYDNSWLTLETFYLNPTINQLSSVLFSFLNDAKKPVERDRVAEMRRKINKYIDLLPKATKPCQTAKKDKYSVAVTGTTGYLGQHLLKSLTRNPQISRIYCLNRSPSAKEIFNEPNTPHGTEIIFLQVDFTAPNLGLSDEDYSRLIEDCDLIVHNAWKVDFNLSLASFDPNLQSLTHLVTLSAKSPLRPRIVFVSSVSATGVWSAKGHDAQTIPESIVPDLDSAMRTGYAESKRVAEHVLDAAARRSHVPVTVLRLGQLVPGDDCVWPENDLIPLFLRTCRAIDLLASDFIERIDWIPVDRAAEMICEIVGYELTLPIDDEDEMRVFNLVNPRGQSWGSVLPVIQSWCGPDTRVVSMQEWVEELQKIDTSDSTEVELLSALRLLPMFRMMAEHGPMHRYAMEGLMAVNDSIHRIPNLDEPWFCSVLERLQ